MQRFLSVTLLCVCSAWAFAQTRVVMLGTGTPNADPERSGPSVAIVVNGSAYLVDAGPGVVRRASAAESAGVKELAQVNLRRVFLTHLHSDHTTGLPDLMFTPWVLSRSAPLEVYGPKGTRNMVKHLLEAYKADIDLRTHSLEPTNKTGWKAEAHEITAGVVYKDDNVTVTAFRVPHSAWKEAFGYVFQTRDRKIVISGDCTPNDEIVRQCDGCDVLVHEVYSSERYPTRPPEWQKYHAQSHTSAKDLAGIATRARPRLLVLYHQLFWGTTDEKLVQEVKDAGYTGEVRSGKDLEVY